MAPVTDPGCPCCTEDGRLTCAGCKNIKYCSAECQQADWPSHKLLCKTFKDFQERPGPNMCRVIALLPDETKPRFMWCPVKYGEGFGGIESYEVMQTREVTTSEIFYNTFTRKPGRCAPILAYDDEYLRKYRTPNKSVDKATSTRQGHLWKGPLLAYGGIMYPFPNTCEVETVVDLDTRSFSDVVAFLVNYNNQDPAHKLRISERKVLAVKANCAGEQRRSGVPPFVQVEVPAFHPIIESDTGLSSISAKVGMPLLTARYDDGRKFEGGEAGDTNNQGITFMHLECDPNVESDVTKGKLGFRWAPVSWQNAVGNVLIVSRDRQPLKVDTAAAFAAYCQHHLGPLFEEAGEREAELGRGSYKQKAANEVTLRNGPLTSNGHNRRKREKSVSTTARAESGSKGSHRSHRKGRHEVRESPIKRYTSYNVRSAGIHQRPQERPDRRRALRRRQVKLWVSQTAMSFDVHDVGSRTGRLPGTLAHAGSMNSIIGFFYA
ncbi:hypothetical protein LTR37_016337 [Vermiconidia calcicola]|uniref:Uncharacterized protein n=1 Tax=Vermiconidia calcicola TaxID=1690605 RepID=A0ACC3MPR9_9PEZI|nr:hypothetical protein LTR37_016337 [Vermiconidia calcicola]